MKYYHKIIFKINAILVLSITALLTIFAINEYKSMSLLLFDAFQKDRVNAISRLDSSLPEQLWNLSEAGYERIMLAEMNIPHLHTIVLVDESGEQLTSFNRVHGGKIEKLTKAPALSKNLVADREKLVFTLDHSVGGDKKPVGEVLLYWSTDHIQERLDDIIRNTLYKIIILDVLIVLVIFFSIKHIITRPLDILNESFGEIARGEGNLVDKLPVLSKDEFGVLAKTFNGFLDGLHAIVSKVAHGSQDLFGQSQESAEYSAKIESDLMSQDRSMHVLSHSASLLENFSSGIAKFSQDSSEFAKNTLDKTEQAKVNIETSINKTFVLADNINKTSESMKVLSQDLEKVSSIVDMIKLVSARSNILAYNATIEAAQAGESGKGFAIVATEMKELSRRTNEAVVQVNEIIEEIIKDKELTIGVLSDTKSQAKDSVEQATLAAGSLKETVSYLKEISKMSQSISESANRQMHLTSEVNTAIKEMELVFSETVDTTRKSAGIANKVELLSDSLSGVVSKFKIKEKNDNG